jgi:hypothetical protein
LRVSGIVVLLVAAVLFVEPSRHPILLVGDSILESAADETVAALAADPSFRPTIEAVSGSGLTACNGAWWDGVRWLDRIPALDGASSPELLVVELGTGDFLCPERYERDGVVDAVLAGTDVPVVVWLLPAAGPWNEPHRAAMVRIRAALRHAAWAHGGRLRLVDTNPVAERPGSLEPDGVHYTPLGQARLADLIRASVADATGGFG